MCSNGITRQRQKRVWSSPKVTEAKRLIEAQRERGWIELTERYGKNFNYQGALATCDPTVIQTLLMSREHTRQRSVTYKLAARIVPGAPGLLFMDSNEWITHLHAAMPPLTRASVDTYAEAMHRTLDDCLHYWQEDRKSVV